MTSSNTQAQLSQAAVLPPGWRFARNADGSIGIWGPPPRAGESKRTSDVVYAVNNRDLHELLGRLADHQGESIPPEVRNVGDLQTNDVVLETLTEKIQRQDRFIAELQAELQRTRQASVDTMLGQLRLREAVLLYVGQDPDNFAQQIAENFSSEVRGAVSASLFVLDNAPVPPEAREAISKATNHGMNRW